MDQNQVLLERQYPERHRRLLGCRNCRFRHQSLYLWLIDRYRHLLMVIMMVLVHKHYRASLNLYFRLILHRNLHPFRQQVLLKEFYLQAHLLVLQP